MGGALSPAKAGLVYRGNKKRFHTSASKWRAWGHECLRVLRIALQRGAGCIATADDDVGWGTTHCACCLGKLTGAPYPLRRSTTRRR